MDEGLEDVASWWPSSGCYAGWTWKGDAACAHAEDDLGQGEATIPHEGGNREIPHKDTDSIVSSVVVVRLVPVKCGRCEVGTC